MKKTKIKPQTKIYKNIDAMFKTWTKERQPKISPHRIKRK